MQLSDFHFELPKELIAQKPVYPRDQARLLVYERNSGTLTHSRVAEIASFLPPNCVFVANNSKVRKGRLYAITESKKEIEVLILEYVTPSRYRCLIGGKKIKPGSSLEFYATEDRNVIIPLTGFIVESEPNDQMSTFVIEFISSLPLEETFEKYGQTPLPPYITASLSDEARYQTVYAQDIGSAAAPTAGLHFTPNLISDLIKQGMSWQEVTLHVGMGTFLPLRNSEVEKNILHTEQTHISPQTAQNLNQFKRKNAPIVTIGTTSTRTLEAHTNQEGEIYADWLATQLFIYPGYQFRSVNHLLTNFHLPNSSLLLLVAAFLGNSPELSGIQKTEAEMTNLLHQLYRTAIKEKYRFFSFGDAMLLL